MRILPLLFVFLLGCEQAFAQPAPDAALPSAAPQVASEALSAPPSAVPSALPSVASTPSVEPVLPTEAEVTEALAFYRKAKAAVQAPTVFGISSALALLLNLLIGAIRRRGSLARHRNVKILVACAGALAGGLAAVVPGMPIYYALVIALGPFLAMVIHEFTKKSPKV